MKYLLLLLMTGCASATAPWSLDTPEQRMTVDKDIHAMSRNEVITAVQECESSGLRAVMVYAKRKINNHTTDIVADVTCAPKYRY
jgi:hypothetical protein